jgi:hypothetical protein
MRVLTRELGDDHSFTIRSPNHPTFTWTFDRFSEVTAQVKEARIWAGIHFRHLRHWRAGRRDGGGLRPGSLSPSVKIGLEDFTTACERRHEL